MPSTSPPSAPPASPPCKPGLRDLLDILCIRVFMHILLHCDDVRNQVPSISPWLF